jgi:hypothetical protein
MGIKICGHKVRWQKPIKIYTFLKALCLVMVIGGLAAQPASAADILSSKQASTGAATAASSALMRSMVLSAKSDISSPWGRLGRSFL